MALMGSQHYKGKFKIKKMTPRQESYAEIDNL